MAGRASPLIAERNARVVAYIQAHPEEHYSRVAQRFGITRRLVSQIAVTNDIRRGNGNRLTPVKAIDLAEVDRRWRAGESYISIAASYGVSVDALRQRRRREGVARPPTAARSTSVALRRAQTRGQAAHKPAAEKRGLIAAHDDTPEVHARQGAERDCNPAPYACFLCTILLDKIPDGVAMVEYDGVPRETCEICVEDYHKEVLHWVRPPIKLDVAVDANKENDHEC